MKKVFSVFLALVTLLSLLSVGVAVSAATPDTQVIEAAAGETIKIKFSEDNCYGVSGAIEYSNRNLFASLTPGGSTSYGKITENAFILSSADKVTCEVVLTVKIASDAKVGDTCVVSFTDCELVENNLDFSGRSDYTKSVTVKVIKKATTATKAPTTTTKKPTKAPTTTTTAKKPSSNLDFSELKKQISIAESLNEKEYTADSWAKLESALKAAKKALKATTQKDINKAADALKQAIAELVKIDASALRELLAQVRDFLENDEKGSLFGDLLAAIEQAEAALESGDQDAINAAYDALKAAFEALKAKLNEWSDGKVVVQEVEVEADCDENCHVWSRHLLWLILLIISAVLNVIFIVLVVLYFIKRKKNAADNTPLVDYNINDD